MTTFDDIVQTQTLEQIRTQGVAVLRSGGINMDVWADADPGRAMFEIVCDGLYQLQGSIANIGKQGLREYAEKDNLTLHALDVYQTTRQEASCMQGSVILVNDTASPLSIGVGDLLFSDTTGELTYRNNAAVTVPANGAASCTILAQQSGAASNISTSELVLSTVMSGLGFFIPTSAWITTAGRDEESDSRLSARTATQWSDLSAGTPADKYAHLIYDAVPAITRIGFAANVPAAYADPDGYITVATPAGAPSSTELASAAAAIVGLTTFGNSIQVRAAVNVTLTLKGWLYCRGTTKSAFEAVALPAIRAAVQDWALGVPMPDDAIVAAYERVPGFSRSAIQYVEGSRYLQSGGTIGALGGQSVFVVDLSQITVVEE